MEKAKPNISNMAKLETIESRSTYQNIVRTIFNNAEIKSIHRLRGGIVNASFEINLTNPDIQLHLKVYRGDDAENRATKENLACDLISKQTNIPIPALYSLDTSKTIASEIFTLQSSLPGITLEAVLDKLSADDQTDIALQLGECLGQLHGIYFKEFGNAVYNDSIGERSSWRTFFLHFVSNNIDFCKDVGIIDTNLVNSIEKHIVKWLWLLPEVQQAVFVHKDFHPGNIKVHQDQKGNWVISGVYDFEHAIAGHNEFDFAKPYCMYFDTYPQMKKPMLRAYNNVSELSPLFESRINKLYRLAEITDFLVFGVKHRMNSEITENLFTLETIVKGD